MYICAREYTLYCARKFVNKMRVQEKKKTEGVKTNRQRSSKVFFGDGVYAYTYVKPKYFYIMFI